MLFRIHSFNLCCVCLYVMMLWIKLNCLKTNDLCSPLVLHRQITSNGPHVVELDVNRMDLVAAHHVTYGDFDDVVVSTVAVWFGCNKFTQINKINAFWFEHSIVIWNFSYVGRLNRSEPERFVELDL